MKNKLLNAVGMSGIPVCLIYMGLAGTIAAQTTTQTEIRSGTVVYVSGNDVVVKMDDGTVKHVVAPDGATADVDGKTVTVHDLKPGMHLTKTITTTTTNENVTSVRTVKGKVWMVNAPYLIVTLANGQNKQYKVPDGMKFDVDGQQKTVFDLKKGMNLTATIVTTTPTQIVSSDSRVTGTAPVVARAPKPPTPPLVGVLLIEEVAAPAPATMASNAAPAAAPEPKPARLPKTGSNVPLVGLIGLVALSSGLVLRIRRLYL
jgi:LPXTG-motif cell wall-anchored protein